MNWRILESYIAAVLSVKFSRNARASSWSAAISIFKLDHTKLGPYLIEEKRGPVTYKLRLPEGMNIHPVFYVALLELAPPGAKVVPVTLIKGIKELLY